MTYSPYSQPGYPPGTFHPGIGYPPGMPPPDQGTTSGADDHLVIPTDGRALEIYALGGAVSLLVAELTFNPILVGLIDYEVSVSALNIRDSTPFRKAGHAWTLIADQLTGGDSCDDPLQTGATKAATSLDQYWQGPAAGAFTTFVTDDLAPNIADLSKATRGSAQWCTTLATALDTAFASWVDAAEDALEKICIAAATAAIGGGVATVFGGPLVGLAAAGTTLVLGVVAEFIDYMRALHKDLKTLFDTVTGQTQTLHDQYTALTKHFDTRAHHISTATLAVPPLTAGTIATPPDWHKKPSNAGDTGP